MVIPFQVKTKAKPPMKLWPTPPSWKGETVVILGNGPSLNAADIALVIKHEAKIIGLNHAYQLNPNIDLLYGCDAIFWNTNPEALVLDCMKVGLPWNGMDSKLYRGWQDFDFSKIRSQQSTGHDGLETKKNGLSTGHNSGYQAINLAIKLGAKKIILLGFDMRSVKGLDHFKDRYIRISEYIPPYHLFIKSFTQLPALIKNTGIEIINSTPGSALDMFPNLDLLSALR